MNGLRTEDFDFALPEGAIAQTPAARRDDARLLVLDRRTGAASHHGVRELPELLPKPSLLVVNDSRVFPARLVGRRASGGRVEFLLVEELGPGRWRCMLRSSKPLRSQEVVGVPPRAPDAPTLEVRLATEPDQGRAEIEFDPQLPVGGYGSVPLPPYIRRPAESIDGERYQTVYARAEGSVAAPTAGLHFTPALLDQLEEAGVRRVSVTLHVGPGTFAPVRAASVSEHRLEPERYELTGGTAEAVHRARAEGRPVVAVGTTAVRVLEATGGAAGSGRTGLFIAPGHAFRVVDALLTNFHLPRSTLLMLVCAFAGREPVLAAYAEAVARGYRFYSYGDAMLIR
ncbi:MAG: tRNA preQ1(34) S-adenosylmethionine ribosyltransferase-isomerase QueA [Deltaproteobacteria bacterium]|nr:tRNA preQ1(34) S-adenosylmethionine ribosyltransferase-isomerase QueA [Deltaproteobacteria bacterium]